MIPRKGFISSEYTCDTGQGISAPLRSVSGSEGVTYLNRCVREGEGLAGSCQEPGAQPKEGPGLPGPLP